MKATLERNPGSRVVLDIEVPPEEMAPEIEQAFRRLARQVRIPGFRPGKAPALMVERAVGRPRILDEALNPLVTKAYREAVASEGLSPLDQPEIEVKAFEDGQPLHFVATVAVRPEVRLGDYRSIHVQPAPETIGEAEIDRALEELRETRATWIPVEAPAEDGQLVILQTVGQVENGPRIDERRVEGVLGTRRLRPDIEAAVRGLSPSEFRDLDMSFPEDDPVEALRGKQAHVRVQLLEVKSKELPPVDDAFAADVSETSTLEELRAELGNRLRQVADRQAEQAALDEAVTAAVDGAEVELPQVMVDHAVDNLLADLQRQLASAGTAFSVYLASQGKTAEQVRQELTPGAERRVKAQLVLQALARDAGVWPEDSEVQEEIGRQAAQSGLDPAHYRRLAERPDNLAAIVADLARTRALRWLHDHALDQHEHEHVEAAPAAEGEGGQTETPPARGKRKGKSE